MVMTTLEALRPWWKFDGGLWTYTDTPARVHVHPTSNGTWGVIIVREDRWLEAHSPFTTPEEAMEAAERRMEELGA